MFSLMQIYFKKHFISRMILSQVGLGKKIVYVFSNDQWYKDLQEKNKRVNLHWIAHLSFGAACIQC